MSPSKNGKPGNGAQPPEPPDNSDKNSDTPLPPLVPQPGGRGAIYQGGIPGNRGNRTSRGGPTPSRLRRAMRLSFARRRHVLEEIADGAIPRVTEKCEECGHVHEVTLDSAALIRALPTVRDRIAALAALAQYSDIKQVPGISEELVGRLMDGVVEAFASIVDEEAFQLLRDPLVDAIEERWVESVARDLMGRAG